MVERYTKGEITYERDDEGNVRRVDKPTNRAHITVGQKKGGGSTGRPTTIIDRFSKEAELRQGLNNKSTISETTRSTSTAAASKPSTEAKKEATVEPAPTFTENYWRTQQSIDPTRVDNTLSAIRDSEGRVRGVEDRAARQSVSFQEPLSREQEKNILIEEQIRTERRRQNDTRNSRGTTGQATSTRGPVLSDKNIKEGFFKEQIGIMRERVRTKFPQFATQTLKKTGEVIAEEIQSLAKGSQRLILRGSFRRKAAREARQESRARGDSWFQSSIVEPFKARQESRKELRQDPDVQKVVVGGALLATGSGAAGAVPKIASDVVIGVTGARSVVQAVKNPSPETVAYSIIGGAFAVGGFRGAVKTGINQARFINNPKYITPDALMNKEVLAGNKKAFTVGSTAEVKKAFQATRTGDGKIIGVHASPERISTSTVQSSRKGAKGQEDPGFYVFPMKESTDAFLRQSGSQGVTFNPLASGARGTPTFTKVRAEGFSTLPQSVVEKPGFKAVEEFFEQNPNTGQIYRTKRGQIGVGEVPRQRFYNDKTGKWETTMGTIEGEGIVGKGSTLSFQEGFFYKEYTRINNQKVGLRTADLVNDGKTIPKGNRLTSAQDFDTSLSKSTYSYVEPASSGTRISFFSSSNVQGNSPITTYIYTPTVGEPSLSTSSFSGSSNYSLSSGFVPPSPSTPTLSGSKSRIVSPSPSPLPSPVSTRPSPKRSSGSGSSGGGGSSETFSPSTPSDRPSSPVSPGPSSPSRPSSPSSSPSFVPSYGYESATSSNLNTPSSRSRNPFFKQESGSPRYQTFVRRRGAFKSIGTFKTASAAYGRGLQNVGSTAAASFKVVDRKSGFELTSLSTPKGFRMSQREKGVYIERRSRRIKSGGELQEITFKGVRASKKKKKKELFNL